MDLNAQALTSAGGKIITGSGEIHSIVLPAWRSGGEDVNSYTVTGVAVDRKGNRSERSETRVVVTGTPVSGHYSTHLPSGSNLPSDGKSQQLLTLSVMDVSQAPLDINPEDITVNVAQARTAEGATVSALARKSTGVFEMIVTSGTVAETLSLTPVVHGVSLATAKVEIVSDLPDASRSAFSAAPDSIAADNAATVTLSLTAKDVLGNTLTGIADRLSFAAMGSKGASVGTEITVSSVTESATPGMYTATLKGTRADVWTILPRYNGTDIRNLSTEVKLTAGTVPDNNTSEMTVSPALIAANNRAFSTLRFAAKDAFGNGIRGIADKVAFGITDVNGVVPVTGMNLSSVSESGEEGVYTATLKGTLAGNYTVIPTFSGSAVGNLSVMVELGAGDQPGDAQSSFTATPTTIIANGVDESAFILTLKDSSGNVITGSADKLALRIGGGNTGVTLSNLE
jgi:adhesin/invasin